MNQPPDSVTVLIVEDERGLADAYADALDGDYTVRTAYTGAGALDRIDESVDVVLLDRRLPDIRGTEVLERIREADVDPRVCMVTAVEPDFDIVEMGFDDYAVKPVFADELHEIVRRLVVRSTYEDRVQALYSISSKLALLEAEKPRDELERTEEYQALREEFMELRERVDAAVDAMGDRSEELFRDLMH